MSRDLKSCQSMMVKAKFTAKIIDLMDIEEKLCCQSLGNNSIKFVL